MTDLEVAPAPTPQYTAGRAVDQAALLKAFQATYRARLACEAVRLTYPITCLDSGIDVALRALCHDMTDATLHKAHDYEREQRRPGRVKT